MFDADSDASIAEFIDKYISCQLPDEKTDPELHNIVKEVQSHSRNHTKSCKKGQKHCRFGFPKPPVRSTFITRPPPEDEESTKGRARTKLKSIWDSLHDPAVSVKTTDELLADCNMTYDEFHSCLQLMSDNSAVMMRRDPKDCWINCYNPLLLRAWNANMDIQYVLNPYSCVMYILSYITKAEHEMSEYLKCVVKDSCHENASDLEQMKQIMQAYSKNREVSVQEAVTRACSLKLKSCSRNVVFIPTDDNALKMSLPMAQLEARDPDSDNIWMTGLIEKYKARPATPEFEGMCMADFVSKYRVVYGSEKDGKNVIPLEGNMGFIQKRTRGKDAVICYARFSEKKDPEKCYGSLLKVYIPFRSERQFKIRPFLSYANFYHFANIRLPGSESVRRVWEIVEENRDRYEMESDAIEAAINDFVEVGPIEDAWANFAPNSELIRVEALADRQAGDPSEDNEQDDVPEFRKKTDRQTAVPLVECPALSSTELRQMYQSLNQTQAAVFYKIRDWALRYVNGHKPDQFFYFVTGGAGTGKSHLIKCIYNEVTKILRRLPALHEEEDISTPTVLLTSFTGTAAFNISGSTHSILKLPKNLKPPYQGLGNSLDEIRIFLKRLQVIVIDEVSMVSKELFAYVDLRLQQIKGRKKPFGGVSILCVGDFFQLSPVGKTKALCVFEENTVDIWRDNFQIITLTEIMRQKDDAAFAEMLNRLRVKKKEEPLLDGDRALLASRTFAEKSECPLDVLHIFPTNKEVHMHNNVVLSLLCDNVIYVDAEDHIKDERTGRMAKQKTPCKGRKGDLPDTLLLSEGARVVITRNLDTSDGLVNGSFGKISRIIKKVDPSGKAYVDSIGLEFDSPTAGLKHRQQGDNIVYIERVEERSMKKGLVRRQFPLKLAYASTAHKVQGATSTSAVVSLKRVFEAGMAYVALSRTTSLQGLDIIEYDEKRIYCNEEVLDSLESMPKADIGDVMPLLKHAKTSAHGSLTVIHHNVEGLLCHIDDVKKHHEMFLGDILCFTETHLFGSAIPQQLQLNGYNMFCRNRQVSYSSFSQLASQKGGGVAIYAKNHIQCHTLQYVSGVTDLEFLAVKITSRSSCYIQATGLQDHGFQ
ncbi:hypothetical protein ACEWY4_028078 [Coilia grayii]|uniref:ATP-dependent DNA helicase n=1 Tax=Coilia grayii TaxID=363190 RepID=A0ABD1IQP6_9TELE